LDVSGAAVFLMAALMASWIRLAADSLIASAFSTAGFAVAMLYARSLFTRISQAIFGMPLIDPVRVRIFLVTWSLILLVLLFVPTALINSAGRKAVPRGRLASNQQGQRPFAKSNAVVALICIGVMVAGLLWLV
ncbi:MAG TPA: hypothetical protein VFD19_05135, partial [Clostridia bacterium]|nr:hypothetical protein [Clostridia bacterium]